MLQTGILMPALKNPKYESFWQHRVVAKTQDEVYKRAGYKPSRQHAHDLGTKRYIIDRMAELQASAAEVYECTVESMARQLDEDRRFAYECKTPSAAVAASVAKCKLFGLAVDRSVVNMTHNYALMTEAELRFEIAAIHAEARALKAGVRY